MADIFRRTGANILSRPVGTEREQPRSIDRELLDSDHVPWTSFWTTSYKSHHNWKKPEKVLSPQRPRVKPWVVFVLGGPGCGKGTQCANIVRDFGWTHLSAGDLLRAEVASESEDGAMIATMIKEGQIVPVDVTVNLLRKAILNSGRSRFLVDGFPRNEDNMRGWQRIMQNDVEVPMVLYFDCPEDVMRARIMKRGETSGRADDNEETLVKRFRTFVNDSVPIVQRFREMGKLVEVSAVPPPDQVYSFIRPHFLSLSSMDVSTSPKRVAIPVRNQQRSKPQVVFVLGGPGCGKGTQCNLILENFPGWVHLSAGDLLREEVQRGSKNGQMIQQCMAEGSIVPVSVTVELLKNAMIQSQASFFLIDGFPRNLDNANGWTDVVGNSAVVRLVLFFECSEDVMRDRLLRRGVSSGRVDDNRATIVKRFRTFMKETMPIIERYQMQGKVVRLNAEHQPNVIFASVRRYINEITNSAPSYH